MGRNISDAKRRKRKGLDGIRCPTMEKRKRNEMRTEGREGKERTACETKEKRGRNEQRIVRLRME